MSSLMREEFAPIIDPALKPVEVLETIMKIHELSIERPSIIAYLQSIAPEKQEIALIHALEVGVTEVLSRRERSRH